MQDHAESIVPDLEWAPWMELDRRLRAAGIYGRVFEQQTLLGHSYVFGGPHDGFPIL